jgi:iron complex transport system substrate-binding protein
MDPESLSSLEIDEAVRNFSARDQPVYKLQDQTLLELEPDLLITQDHCRVCAVTKSDIEKSKVCHRIPQLILKPSTLNDCLGDILKIAVALGYPERGKRLYDTLQIRMSRVKELGSSLLKENGGISPRVALLEWCHPVMGCGYWLPELITLAGGTPIFSAPKGGATPTISFQSLLDSKPNVVVLALCGFSITRAAKEIREAWTTEQIQELTRICHDQIYVTDGNFLFNRSGPRIVESAEVLLEAIYPPNRGHYDHFGSSFLMTLQQALDLGDKIDTGSSKSRPPVEEIEIHSENIPSDAMPVEPASEVVAKQLKCLRVNDIHSAFAYNSLANQKRWCDATQFIRVLKSHNDFKRILHEIPELDEPASSSNGVVNAKLSNGQVLVWTCVVEKDQEKGAVWRTERVGIQ